MRKLVYMKFILHKLIIFIICKRFLLKNVIFKFSFRFVKLYICRNRIYHRIDDVESK